MVFFLFCLRIIPLYDDKTLFEGNKMDIRRVYFSFVWRHLDINTRKKLEQDAMYYMSLHKTARKSVYDVLIEHQAYRAIFYYRTSDETELTKFLMKVLEKFVRNTKTVEIHGKIGPRLIITHNCSILNLKRAGSDLTVLPYVLIGKGKCINGKDIPVFGKNVHIGGSSTIIGGITIGNNVNIGAHSLINYNVPSNCTVVGNPARIIKLNEQKCNILLSEYNNAKRKS